MKYRKEKDELDEQTFEYFNRKCAYLFRADGTYKYFFRIAPPHALDLETNMRMEIEQVLKRVKELDEETTNPHYVGRTDKVLFDGVMWKVPFPEGVVEKVEFRRRGS